MTDWSTASRINGLADLREALRQFAAEREWEQFHTPKNLAIALSIEASELLEHFLWAADDDSGHLTPEKHQKIGDEAADVLLYLVRLADKLGIDLLEAAKSKMERNAEKYPVSKARGSSKKYTEL